MKKLIILFCIYSLLSETCCDEIQQQQQVAASEVRKVRVPSGTSSSHLNSVGSDPSIGVVKSQPQQEQVIHRLPSQQQLQQQLLQQPHHTQQPQHPQQHILSQPQQQPHPHHHHPSQHLKNPHPTLDYSSLPPPQSSIFNHQQSGQQPQVPPAGGYFVAVNTQGNGAHQPNGAQQQPIYMQYIPQTQGQPANGLQYIQLLSPRTVLYNPYLQTLPQQFLQQPVQNSHHQSTQQPNYGPIPQSQTYQTPFSPIHQPIGSYSSHVPVAQAYYGPTNRFHQVNGPSDLSLNTMEYVPIPQPRSLKARP